MFPNLFTRIAGFDSTLIRNIKGIRKSQHLFGDLDAAPQTFPST